MGKWLSLFGVDDLHRRDIHVDEKAGAGVVIMCRFDPFFILGMICFSDIASMGGVAILVRADLLSSQQRAKCAISRRQD